MKSISKDFDLKRFVSHNIRELTLFAILIVISILVQVRTGGRFLSGSNLNDLLRETAILMMVSVGMMMVILTGCIDLSLGSTMGLAGMICALTLRDHRETPIIVIVLIALGIGLLAGLLNGFIVAKLRIFPLIGTLGVCDMLRGLYIHGQGFRNQQSGIHSNHHNNYGVHIPAVFQKRKIYVCSWKRCAFCQDKRY